MRILLTFLAVLGFALPACGGSSDSSLTGDAGHPGGGNSAGGAGASGASGAGGASGSNAAQACADVAKARCQKRDTCTNGVSSKVKYADEASCETRDTAGCTTSLAAAGTSATPSTVSACAAAVTAESCGDALAGTTPAACIPAAGAAASGAPCQYDGQCASAYCGIPTGVECGTCAPAPAAGDSCAATGSCGRDLSCTKDTSVCVVPVAMGGACGKGKPCADRLTCVGELRLQNQTCQPLGATVGAACDPLERTGPACDRGLGLFCSANRCAQASFAAAGQPCEVVPGGFAICTGGATCELPKTTATTGTCAAAVADGAPCDPAKGGACLPPARCILDAGAATGTCRLPDPTACK